MDHAKAFIDFVTALDLDEAMTAVLRPWCEDILRREIAKFEPRPELVYRGPYDFLLQHGRWFTKRADVPERLRGLRGYCYGMAIDLAAAWPKYKYYEGIAVCHAEGAPFPHAWNVSSSQPDVVVDRCRQDGIIYCGVEFSVERADDATWNGDACILLDDKRGYPLLKQRWNGEDYSIKWPSSERLDILRTRDKDRFLKWYYENKHYHDLRGGPGSGKTKTS